MEDPDRASASSTSREFSGAASTSSSSVAMREDDESAVSAVVRRGDRDGAPEPFPERTTVYHDVQYLTTTTEHEENSTLIRDDSWSCIVLVLTFWFFVSMTLILGVYGAVNLQLGPNSSLLINPNRLFVEYIKVEQLDEAKSGPVLYGFYKTPALDVVKTWSEAHNTFLPVRSHKVWTFILNEGSQINISYSVNSSSSSSLILVIAQGSEGFAQWLEDPSYPNTTLSWNNIHGNGVIQQNIIQSSTYYVAVGNLNSEKVEVHLDIRVKAYLYNTTGAYYGCTIFHHICNLKLFFPDENDAVLTTSGPEEGSSGDWYVKLSYGPRWITYFVGIGGMTVLMVLVLSYSNKFLYNRRDRTAVEAGSERAPLLSRKDDDLSSWGSSYDSVSDHDEDFEEGLALEGKPLKDGEYNNNIRRLCAICFDAPRDCFFLPCGHCVACFACGTRIAEVAGTCPICRRNMKKVRKIFTV